MRNNVNAKYMYGSAAPRLSYREENVTFVEFPQYHEPNQPYYGQHGRKQTISNRARVGLGEEHYRNLVGAPSKLSGLQLALSGSVFTSVGVALVLLSSIL